MLPKRWQRKVAQALVNNVTYKNQKSFLKLTTSNAAKNVIKCISQLIFKTIKSFNLHEKIENASTSQGIAYKFEVYNVAGFTSALYLCFGWIMTFANMGPFLIFITCCFSSDKGAGAMMSGMKYVLPISSVMIVIKYFHTYTHCLFFKEKIIAQNLSSS
jgi:hypothetical protein